VAGFYADVQGFAVLAGNLLLPRTGPWIADVVVDGTTLKLAGATVLNVNEGAVSFTGRTLRGGENFGKQSIRIVGGGGGLYAQLPGQSYAATTAKTVIADILTAAGEKLAASSTPTLLATQLHAWSRVAGPCAQSLSAIADYLGAAWRTLPDGTIWVGTETYPPTPAGWTFDLISKIAAHGRFEIGTISPMVLPGMTFTFGTTSYKVSAVQYRILPSSTRAWVFYE